MKSALTIKEQIEKLKSRNLIIEDKVKAEQFLFQNNYYRLSDYWRKYQINPKEKEDNFVNNTTLESIITIYELDASLTNILLEGIRIFEICFRTRFAYYTALSDTEGQFLYLKKDSYNEITKDKEHEDLVKTIERDMQSSKEIFIKHYEKKGEKIPIWVAVEVLSFSMVSKMYANWKNKEIMEVISESFKTFKTYRSSVSIIRCIVILRNLCAHQARIWNKNVTTRMPKKRSLKKTEPSDERAHWRVICTLMALVDEIEPNKNYSTRVKELCKKNEEFFKGLTHPTL